MYRKCATEVSVLHQKQVADSLLKLMETTSWEDVTVTQLCREAGVTRRVFYHLFSNKTGALHALIDQRIMAIESYRRDEPDDMLRFFLYWREQRPLVDALEKSGMTGLLLERMIGNVLSEDRDVLYWLGRNGWENNSKEVVIFILSGLMGLIYSWHFEGYRKTPEELAGIVEKMFSQK